MEEEKRVDPGKLRDAFISAIMKLTPEECQQVIDMWKERQNGNLLEKSVAGTTQS